MATRKQMAYWLMVISVLGLFYACNRTGQQPVIVDFNSGSEEGRIEPDDDTLQPLRVAIATVISPRESLIYYQDIFEALSDKLNRNVEFKQRTSYQEVNDMLAQNLVDMAFICSGAYIMATDYCELLVAPVVNGRPYYQGYIITHNDSGIQGFEDFRNRSFTYSDPLCFTGKLFVDNRLAGIDTRAEDFFSEIQFSMSHDISIQMVSRALIDGASVNGLIFEYMKVYHPEFTNNIRIIEKTSFHGIPPVVNTKNMHPELKQEIQQFFLSMHTRPTEQEMLKKLLIDRFILVGDTLYNGIREARSRLLQ
jgi:phosphonate transport system substrate-binding protein